MEKSDFARTGQTAQKPTTFTSSSGREQRYIRSGKMNFVQNPSIAFYGQDRVAGFSGDMFCCDPNMSRMQNEFALNFPKPSAPIYSHLKRSNDDSPTFSSPSSSDGFDYDFNRPIKKYIGEDKVVEIFDRLHIREGENYIVEDIDDMKDSLDSAIDIDPEHNVIIEELPEEQSGTLYLKLSPEFKDVLSNPSPACLTDKLIQNTRDSISKALVIWQPSPLQIALNSSNTSDDKNLSTVQDPESDDEDFDNKELEKVDKNCEKNEESRIQEIEFDDVDCDDMDLDDEMDAVILAMKPAQEWNMEL